MTIKITENLYFRNEFCPECNDRIIQNGHEIVCPSCGLVVNQTKYENSYQMNEVQDSDFRAPDQFVSIGKTIDSVTTLGSNIGYFNSDIFYDYKNQIIKPKNQRMYRKLRRYYFLPAKIKNHETDYRILKILNKIVVYLDLSSLVKNRAAYFYKIIKKNVNEVKNHVSLIAFCIFYSLREFSHQAPVGIHELCNVFQEFGHRITPRLIIRDHILYGNVIKQKNKPHKSEDYIVKFVDKVVNWSELGLRMGKKESYWDLQDYKMNLLNYSKNILLKMNNKIRGSRNPYIMAATTVYCADRLIARDFKTKKILTQRIASKSMEIPEYSIRDHFVKVFKPFFKL